MQRIIFVAVFISCIYEGHSIKCHRYAGLRNETKIKTVIEECLPISNNYKCYSITFVKSIKNNAERQVNVDKGCVLERSASRFCEAAKVNENYFNYDLIDCSICEKDDCNKSGTLMSSVLLISLMGFSMFLYNL